MTCDYCENEEVDICNNCARSFCTEHGNNGRCTECQDEFDDAQEDEMEEAHPNLSET